MKNGNCVKMEACLYCIWQCGVNWSEGLCVRDKNGFEVFVEKALTRVLNDDE